ncbi:MAG: multiheme c-type cytochrome [Colwellia sp.]|nr:multiheme c-type cytochrome [Colwellia sp.]MCW9081432.1 multiheme c-type cytochrome [Colwellia sp.]
MITPAAFSSESKAPQQKQVVIANQQCTVCHQEQQHNWQQSDHAKSMAIADEKSVLANFNNTKAEHYGQKAHFFIEGKEYKATISYDDKSTTYAVKYTFGFFPLQQYLVNTGKGKLQVLPFAWDTRKKSDGGQRWYHNYSHEEIRPEDRLHWQQPLQNWNGMCADCHSDGLVRNYNVEKNSFATQWDNINVGCLSCHGDMSNHANSNKKNASKSKPRNVTQDITSSRHPTGQWLRSLGDKTAKWQGEKRDNTFMDTCFACHSLRAPLTDGIDAKKPFLDQFTPQLLAAPMYHADGQIKEEVYVYGSFLQSKMFAQGVSCLDCHDKHTMKLKAEGNGLCLQCHGPEVYNVKEHHQHENNSTGAQCVNCHMPDNRYMGVDDRRDHSFKIPRPDLSISFNTPNACTQCHEEKSNEWAVEQLNTWHGKAEILLTSKKDFMALSSGQGINLEQHLHIIADEKLDVITRATAIQLLSYTTQTLTAEVLAPYLSHEEDLLRLSAASVATLLAPAERVKLVSPLLSDTYKAVRVAAARSLLGSELLEVDQTAFNGAFKAVLKANDISSWRGEGRANQGMLAAQMGDMSAAEKSLKAAINIEPYFETGYINLADLYRSQQRSALVTSVLSSGMKKIPNSGSLNYSFGLHLVRQKKLDKAIAYFEKSMNLSPNDPQYAYTFVLALDSSGQSQQALETLKKLIVLYDDKGQLKELGLYLSQKLNSRADYNWFVTL